MLIDVSQDDYSAAISSALEMITAQPNSAASNAMSTLLANVWDTIAVANACECLMVLDSKSRMVAFALLVGRSLYGRPSFHPERLMLEENFLYVFHRQ